MWSLFKNKKEPEKNKMELPKFLENNDCFVSISVDEEGELFFDFSFNEETFETFVELFVSVSTGTLCAGMCEQIIDNLHKNGNDDLAAQFVERSKQDAQRMLEEQTETFDEEPMISPLDVFSGNE